MVKEADIQLALDELKSQKSVNYTTTAKKFNVSRTTLIRRHKRITVPNHDAKSIYLKRLTNI